MTKRRNLKENNTILVIVEGEDEKALFELFANTYQNGVLKFISKHYRIVRPIICVGGGRQPVKRILERAKQEKIKKEKIAPYTHIFAVCDTDRSFPNMEKAFSDADIKLIATPIRFENVLLECLNEPNKTLTKEEAKKKIIEEIGCEIDWWKRPWPRANITDQQLLSCPLLTRWWEIVGIKQ